MLLGLGRAPVLLGAVLLLHFVIIIIRRIRRTRRVILLVVVWRLELIDDLDLARPTAFSGDSVLVLRLFFFDVLLENYAFVVEFDVAVQEELVVLLHDVPDLVHALFGHLR